MEDLTIWDDKFGIIKVGEDYMEKTKVIDGVGEDAEVVTNAAGGKQSGYKLYEKPTLEADDVIGILATTDKIIKGDKVVWSMDKDFKTIPCKFHRAKPDGKSVSQIVSPEEADWWFMYQTLIGDTVDGYYGCKRIGEKKAKKLLGGIGEKSLKEMWEIVQATYEKCGSNKEDALLNARMARILHFEDYDFKKKEVKLWKI